MQAQLTFTAAKLLSQAIKLSSTELCYNELCIYGNCACMF